MIARNSPKNTQANMMKYNSIVKFIAASVPTEDKYIIAGTIAAFTKQGIKPFKNNNFTNLDKTIINRQAINVAPVPIKISNGPTVENKFANKQPKVKPIVYLGLKKTSKTKNSDSLNCIYEYEIGIVMRVKTTYNAAKTAFAVMFLINSCLSLIIFGAYWSTVLIVVRTLIFFL